ncbi:MAG: transglutaminase-like domain-containing protein [Verrucomicrobiales bacterium]|nr:transglutaminase-like domain-containing protein [Verrucomicrobiales bacterium]
MHLLSSVLLLTLPTLASALTVGEKNIPDPLAPLVSTALETAASNRSEIESAFAKIPPAQAGGLAFLVAHMPAGDLKNLTANYLTENVSLAYQARASVPWGKDLPDELFFNDVLPYASINERRDNWRKDFTDRFLPLVKGCKTPGEAAQLLNQKMWDLVDVRYHATKRPKPDQSPYESIDAGYASCSGLSVLLIDACRAVAVPARFVGTPRWATKRGNHSWVEVWDTDGQWHFTGACEYNKNGLDKTWFANDAAKAISDIPANAIYATSWKPADTSFPLVWDRSIKYVQAANVTGRYAKPDVPKPHRTFIQVFAKPGGPRVPCLATISEDGKPITRGTTRGPGHDTNDMLAVALKPGATYSLTITRPDGSTLTQPLKAPQQPDRQITIYLGQPAGTTWLPAGAAAARHYTATTRRSTSAPTRS